MDNVPCIVVDQEWKIVIKDREYDLAKLSRSQLVENLTSIRKVKNSMYKFRSLSMCIFFYI